LRHLAEIGKNNTRNGFLNGRFFVPVFFGVMCILANSTREKNNLSKKNFISSDFGKFTGYFATYYVSAASKKSLSNKFVALRYKQKLELHNSAKVNFGGARYADGFGSQN
jgi:hypothetical protein